MAGCFFANHCFGVAAGCFFLETMMDKKEIDAIQKISEALDLQASKFMNDVLDQYDIAVTINVLINVATSMLAKGLLMTDPAGREKLAELALYITEQKVTEGHAAVQSLLVIGKAMFPQTGGFTCSPQKKH